MKVQWEASDITAGQRIFLVGPSIRTTALICFDPSVRRRRDGEVPKWGVVEECDGQMSHVRLTADELAEVLNTGGWLPIQLEEFLAHARAVNASPALEVPENPLVVSVSGAVPSDLDGTYIRDEAGPAPIETPLQMARRRLAEAEALQLPPQEIRARIERVRIEERAEAMWAPESAPRVEID